MVKKKLKLVILILTRQSTLTAREETMSSRMIASAGEVVIILIQYCRLNTVRPCFFLLLSFCMGFETSITAFHTFFCVLFSNYTLLTFLSLFTWLASTCGIEKQE